MFQRLFTLAILLVSILWLVISYLPGARAYLPTIAFSQSNSQWLAGFSIIALIAFIAIQIWLVISTVATVRRFQGKRHELPFQLKVGIEFIWTALPIAMTVGLAWAGYELWLHRILP